MKEDAHTQHTYSNHTQILKSNTLINGNSTKPSVEVPSQNIVKLNRSPTDIKLKPLSETPQARLEREHMSIQTIYFSPKFKYKLN